MTLYNRHGKGRKLLFASSMLVLLLFVIYTGLGKGCPVGKGTYVVYYKKDEHSTNQNYMVLTSGECDHRIKTHDDCDKAAIKLETQLKLNGQNWMINDKYKEWRKQQRSKGNMGSKRKGDAPLGCHVQPQLQSYTKNVPVDNLGFKDVHNTSTHEKPIECGTYGYNCICEKDTCNTCPKGTFSVKGEKKCEPCPDYTLDKKVKKVNYPPVISSIGPLKKKGISLVDAQKKVQEEEDDFLKRYKSAVPEWVLNSKRHEWTQKQFCSSDFDLTCDKGWGFNQCYDPLLKADIAHLKETQNEIEPKTTYLWQQDQTRLEYDRRQNERKGATTEKEKKSCENEKMRHTKVFPAAIIDVQVEDGQDTTCLATNRDEMLQSFCAFKIKLKSLFEFKNVLQGKNMEDFWPNICCKNRNGNGNSDKCSDSTGKVKREDIVPFALSQGGTYNRNNLMIEITRTMREDGYFHEGLINLLEKLESLKKIKKYKKKEMEKVLNEFFTTKIGNGESFCGPHIVNEPGESGRQLKGALKMDLVEFSKRDIIENVAVHYLGKDSLGLNDVDTEKFFKKLRTLSINGKLRYDVDDYGCQEAPLFRAEDISIQQIPIVDKKAWVAVVKLNSKERNGYMQTELRNCHLRSYLPGAKVTVKAYKDVDSCCEGNPDYKECLKSEKCQGKGKLEKVYLEPDDGEKLQKEIQYKKTVIVTGNLYKRGQTLNMQRRQLLQDHKGTGTG
eukprot:g691.t1